MLCLVDVSKVNGDIVLTTCLISSPRTLLCGTSYWVQYLMFNERDINAAQYFQVYFDTVCIVLEVLASLKSDCQIFAHAGNVWTRLNSDVRPSERDLLHVRRSTISWTLRPLDVGWVRIMPSKRYV